MKNDAILPFFVIQQLPAGISGLVIAAVFAASMSSLDSSMNSIATALVTDFYRRLRPAASDPTCLKLARYITLLIGLAGTATSLLIAKYKIPSLYDLIFMFGGLFGGGLGGIFILGIFTRRAHARGVLVGLIVSAIVLYLVKGYTNIHFFLFAAIGILTCVIVGYFMSLLIPTRKRNLDGLTIFTKNNFPITK